jgi:urease accessory protein
LKRRRASSLAGRPTRWRLKHAHGATTLRGTALLQLLWLASPALPIGGFSYSEGLEAAVEAQAVTDADSAAAWLTDQLHLVLARSDLAVIARAHAAWQRHDAETARDLNDWVHATRETAELRLQATQMGRSLAAWLADRDADDPRVAALATFAPAPTWPVAWALAAARAGTPVREALLAAAFGWAENAMQAAVRAVPLGQGAGQRILARLATEIPAAADAALALAAGERQAYAPRFAILSAQHEVQYSRLFRS